MCLDASVWAAFDEFCKREALSREQACARAALRVVELDLPDKIVGLLTSYYKEAAECDLAPSAGFSADDGAGPIMSPALRAALDAVGKE